MEQVVDTCVPLIEKISIDDEVNKHMSSCGTADHGVCAICLEEIILEETALVKGCEHAYCVTCILRWASYKTNPCCPQCKHPFLFLSIHRSLDGCIHDYMFEESVCLLLRATWFKPLILEFEAVAVEEEEDFYQYVEHDNADDDDMDEAYFGALSSIRIGNRRWGDNGFVRAGRKEARPVINRADPEAASSSSGSGRKKEAVVKDGGGRRAKRALKREAADKAAAAKHEHHLQRLGLK